ncbi:signal recognition particle-docking protein FtsY [Candidatus Pacearchaeota archaeon]|nr:signal recognition particle-docking protein FtsY [Candidatus Pacearchaeota archaeon]
MFKFLKEKIKSWAEKITREKTKPEEFPEKTEKEKEIGRKEGEKPRKKIIVPAPEKSEEEETKSFFERVREKISKVKISDKEFDVYGEELKTLLLENNVAFPVAEKIISELKGKIVNQEFLKKEVEEQIKDSLKDIIEDILIEPFDLVEKIKEKNEKEKNPYVILFCGINGSGKTTTVAKVAENLKSRGVSAILAAADTFRAASIEQLKFHGDKIGVNVISHEYGSDPASVGFDAIKYAKKNSIECVLIDTAGRMHTAKNLLREMEKIVRVCAPDLKIFIGESITGNDAVEQAGSFNSAIGIDAIILTKADIDEKGGTSLSVGYVVKKPILYLGTGQNYGEIEAFDKKKFVERLGL